MITLKGKDADRFIRKMIKKENSPMSKKDKKLAKDIKKNMSKLRREIEEKYNPTILKKDDGICQRCHKNKATINYTDSIMSYTHGFIELICQECYDKMKRENSWYKDGRKEAFIEVKKLIRLEKKNWINATDWDVNLKQGIKELEEKK